MYIYIYRTTMATSCDVDAPRCTTEVLRVRFHWSRGGFFVGHRPPRDPGDPPWYGKRIKKEMLQNIAEVLHLFRCCTHTPHTTLSHSQSVLHHLLLSFLPFPSHVYTPFVLIGRSWHLGFPGPLVLKITLQKKYPIQNPPKSRYCIKFSDSTCQWHDACLVVVPVVHTPLGGRVWVLPHDSIEPSWERLFCPRLKSCKDNHQSKRSLGSKLPSDGRKAMVSLHAIMSTTSSPQPHHQVADSGWETWQIHERVTSRIKPWNRPKRTWWFLGSRR